MSTAMLMTSAQRTEQLHSRACLVGNSPKIDLLRRLIEKVSKTKVNVLISGESGTGKELVAQIIHQQGPRANYRFVALNCSAIPVDLFESELFGHVRGSFTGANQTKVGLCQLAHKGTLFLDEIGDLDVFLQAKLLRFLQDRKVKSVGGNEFETVDVRVIAATHVDLSEAIKAERFRRDLFYRLNVIPLYIPPLRERPSDIPLLVEHFVRVFSSKLGSPIKVFAPAAMSKIVAFPWKGNVRELSNFVERILVLSKSEIITEENVSELNNVIQLPNSTSPSNSTYLSLKDVERNHIKYILSETRGKKERAAEILGINRKTLYRKTCEYHLEGEF